MLALKKQSETETLPGKNKLRWDVLWEDFSVFISLWIARAIIWRILRRRRKDRAARLKRLHLVKNSEPRMDEGTVPS